MKEFVEKLIGRLEEESDFFSGEPMGSLQKAYYCKGVEKAIEIVNQLAEEYKHKYVSIEVYKQVAGERDIAIEQLHELGYEFGQKIN